MRCLSKFAAFAFAILLLLVILNSPTREARAESAVLLDRIVAVVEDKTIYRSDVIARAKPYLSRIEKKDDTPEHTRKVHREILEKMIDEVIVAAEADLAHIIASNEDVNRAIEDIAKLNKLDDAQLIAELKKQGMTLAEYQQEIRRQLLDAKWTNLKVRSGIREPQTGTEEEKKQAISAMVAVERKKLLARLRAHAHVEIRW